ncbi:gag polyprotein, partial [Fusarium austroafricanum]
NRTKFEHKARKLQRELREAREQRKDTRKSDEELWKEEPYPQLYDENGNRYWNSLRERYIQTAREHVGTADEEEICVRAYHRSQADNPRHTEAPFNPRDDVRTYPTHKEHASISWMSCQHHWCTTHQEEKREQDCFPVALPHQPNDKPYMWYETEGYQVFHWYDSIGVANARYSKELYHAIQEQKRVAYKVEDWQKQLSQEGQEDPSTAGNAETEHQCTNNDCDAPDDAEKA